MSFELEYTPETIAFGLAAFLLGVAPRLFSVAAVRAQYRQRTGVATAMRRLAFFLRPTRTYLFSLDVSRAFEHATRGDMAEARKGLSRWPEQSPYGRYASALLHGWEANWAQVLSVCGADGGELSEHLTRLRAIGELADAEAFESLWTRDARAFRHISVRDASWLYLFAFAGRPELVERLLATRLPPMAEGLRDFWVGTAQLAAGDVSAKERLALLMSAPEATLRTAVAWRLKNGPFAPLVSNAVVSTQAQTFEQVLRFGRSRQRGVPVAVVGIVGSLALAYAAQLVLSLWMDPERVMLLGAMFAPDVFAQGEWWRVISYAWMHFGPAHLAVNAVALFAIGAWLERSFGSRRFLVVYFSSCVGSGLLLALAWRSGLVAEQAIVGASGGVMGLVGAMAAVFFRGAVQEHAPAARRGLAVVSAIIVLQMAFDLAMPQVSFLTHTSGLFIGIVVGLGLLKQTTPGHATQGFHQQSGREAERGTRPT